MVQPKKILAVIPARRGSKSIPRKNIINLGGHPLIAYSIAVAKLSRLINRIIVTTDGSEIVEISKEYGSEVPFLRPSEISQDHSLDIDFFKHALDWLEQKENYFPDLVVHLRPTTPLRDYRLIDQAIWELANDRQATSLRSAHPSRDVGYKLFKKKGNYIDFFGREDFYSSEEYYNYPRQKLPDTYDPNGYVDIIIPKILKSQGLLHGPKIRAFITERVADIDELQDIVLAEKFLKDEKYLPLIDLLNKIKKYDQKKFER